MQSKQPKLCRAAPSLASWFGDHFKLHAFMAQFFTTLPPVAADAVCTMVMNHVHNLADSKQAEELAVIAEFAAAARPDACIKRLLVPGVEALQADIGAEPAGGALCGAVCCGPHLDRLACQCLASRLAACWACVAPVTCNATNELTSRPCALSPGPGLPATARAVLLI